MKKVIDAWTFLEMLIPRELPSKKDYLKVEDIKGKKRSKKVLTLSQSARMKKLELANEKEKVMHYRYYMNSYQKNDLILLLRDYFKSEEGLHNRQYGTYYAFTFEVNKQGKYKEDSLFIPQIQLVIHDILENGKISYHDFTERYEKKRNQFEEEFAAIVADGLGESVIKEIQILFQKYFSILEERISKSYIECVIQDKDKIKLSNNFNSFYLGDLQKIKKLGVNDTLADFINGRTMEVGLDENRTAIEEILAIENLPLGRWPSPVNHRLSLMQQVAVNQALNGEELISSVNGPPGTGKTTLLKDIFAALMVKRAEAMVGYSNPEKAFKKKGEQEIQFPGNSTVYGHNVYELDEEIAQYSMVIASSNNGAVENISEELPLLEETRRYEEAEDEELDQMDLYDKAYSEEAEILDYFSAYATDLLKGDEAWGLFSTALGRANNIKSVGRLFKKRIGEDKKFIEHLSRLADKNSWAKTVEEFNKLRQEIQEDQEELKKYIHTMEEAEEIVEKTRTIAKKDC